MLLLLAGSAALVGADLAPQPRTAAPDALRRALVARQEHRPEEAITLLLNWLAVRPDDTDARLTLGYAFLDLGRLAEAERAFRRVLSDAPNYQDARIGLSRVAQRRGDLAQAQRWLEPVSPDSSDARELRRQLSAGSDSRWRVDVGAAVTAVGGGQTDWRQVDLQVGYRPTRQTSLEARVETSERFGLHDTYVEGSWTRRTEPGLVTYLLVGGTRHADYRPRWQLGGGLSARIGSPHNASVLTLDVREARYATGRVTTVQTGLEQYLHDGHAWITVRQVTVVEGHKASAGALARLDVQGTTGLRFFAGLANAPDIAEGVVTRTTTQFGGAEMALGRRSVLRLSLAHAAPRRGPPRTEVALGWGVRF